MAQNENIKGITIQIGGDVQPLNDAISDATKATSVFEKKLADLNKKLKLDPKNVELLTQKQSLLSDEVANTETTLAALNKAYDNMKKAVKEGSVDVSKEEFDALGESIKNTEKHLDETKGRLEDVNRKLKDTGNEAGDAAEEVGEAADTVEDLGKNSEDAAGGLAALGGASAINISSIVNLTEKIIELAKKMYEWQRQQDDLLRTNDELYESIEKSKKKYDDETKSIEDNAIALEIQLKRIRDLDNSLKTENLTALDAKKKRDQLRLAVEQFNEVCGESVFTINDETGALNENISVGTRFVENVQKRAKAAAQYKRFIEIYTEIVNLEAQNARLVKAQENEKGNVIYEGSQYAADIKKNKEKIGLLQQEADYIEVLINDYTDYNAETTTTTQIVQDLTAAEAERLIRAQEDGYQLTELQQQQLEQYKSMNQEEIASLEYTVQREKELLDLRVQQTTDTNSKIELNTKNSLKNRAKTIEHNTKMVTNYEKNLHELLLIALSQDDEDAKQAMLNYLNTLTDYSTDSMSIVQMMVDDFGKKGGEASWQLINGFKEANTPSQWSNVGVEIGQAAGGGVAKGVEQSTTLVTNAATKLARAIEKQLEGVKVTYHVNPATGIQRNGITIQAMAQGGIVTSPTFSLVGEAGPEAIIPLDRLGGIIESALDGRSSGGQNIMNVYPISMSAQEQDMLLDKFDRRFGDRTARRAI